MDSAGTDSYRLTLKSHAGKALVLSEKKDEKKGEDGDHHETEYVELGEVANALMVKMDPEGYIFNADKPG